MARSAKNKAIVIAFLVLGALIAAVSLVFVVVAALKAGFGFNRASFVLVCAAIALVGVFALWVNGGSVITHSEPDPEVVKMTKLGFWERFKWQYKQDFRYDLIGIGLGFLAILFAITYVEYIEPLFR